MRSGGRIATLAALAAAGAAAAAVAIGAAAWRRGSARDVARLLALARADAPRPAAGREGLPAPVRRWLDRALPADARPPRAVRVRWAGEFRTAPDAPWRPFTAEQTFTVRPPGFVWDARIAMAPLVRVHVRDGYAGGAGSMRARVAGVVPVVDAGGSPEMAASALARWLGEAAWFPAALLAADVVRWTAVDDTTARATVADGAVRASAEFHVAPDGALVRLTALRHRDVDGRAVLTPFEGVYRGEAVFDGVRVPAWAEVAWRLPEGRFAYWRGRPVAIRYER